MIVVGDALMVMHKEKRVTLENMLAIEAAGQLYTPSLIYY